MPETLKGWSIDHRIPLALILTIVLQTAGIVWWTASLAARVDENGRRLAVVERTEAARIVDERRLYERLATFDANVTAIRASLARIETRLERQDR